MRNFIGQIFQVIDKILCSLPYSNKIFLRSILMILKLGIIVERPLDLKLFKNLCGCSALWYW